MGISLKNGSVVNKNSNREMRFASHIQEPCSGINSRPANTIFSMTNLSGAKALSLSDQIGNIAIGKKVNLIVLDLNKVHYIPVDDIYSQIVYSANASNVQHVMINRKWTIYDSKLIAIAEERLLSIVRIEIQNLLN